MKARILMCFTIVVLFATAKPVQLQAQITGNGTNNYVPIWTSGSTLGNSNIFGTQGRIGLGTTTPLARLSVLGAKGTIDLNGGSAPLALQVTGGSGAENSGGFGTQGSGGAIQLVGGMGAAEPIGAGGGTGATIIVSGGGGATCLAASSRCSGYDGGNGGSLLLQPGFAGTGFTRSGQPGNVLLAPNAGLVGIGEMSPTHTLEIRVGGTTLADAWTTRSSLQFKTNIRPLLGALKKVEQLRGVSYSRKDDGRHEIGVIAEEVDRVVPEIVSRDSVTGEVQGVDYSRLVALLIEAVKSQQGQLRSQEAELQQLKRQVEQPTSPAVRR